MARKENNPDKMQTDQETGSKRRYQSPKTPPQAPGSRMPQGREQGRQAGQGSDSEGYDRESQPQGRHSGQRDWQDDAEQSSGRGDGVAGRGSDFDLQKASRDELNAIARDLNIEDFETMNREELVTEIRERS
jgi:hypothetical protein